MRKYSFFSDVCSRSDVEASVYQNEMRIKSFSKSKRSLSIFKLVSVVSVDWNKSILVYVWMHLGFKPFRFLIPHSFHIPFGWINAEAVTERIEYTKKLPVTGSFFL